MLLTKKQAKHLVPNGDECYKFVGQNIATYEEKKKLIELDESYFDVYGFHIITNYEDLKN